ncbi:MAG: MotA/TolQ/ExbB proton channel family protein [Bacteroidales bacterium]
MAFVSNVLYWLSTGLMIPVTIFLLFFLFRALMMVGGFYGLYLSRAKVNKRLNEQFNQRSYEEVLSTLDAFGSHKSSVLEALKQVQQHQKNPILLDKFLGDYEIRLDEEIAQSRMLAKIGPMLGLMGTLIPMGPALVGLATGDVASMANNMQVAFATTVVGIVIGAIGFITLQLRQRWVADDLNILEYVIDSIKEGNA